MKRNIFIAGIITLLSLGTATLQAADEMTMYVARSGSKMRIDGTANMIHTTWQIESPIIGGWMEVGPSFPLDAGQAATPGTLIATNHVFIQVRQLKSVKEDGSHYDDRMDEVTWEHLKESQFKQITFNLTSLTLKEAAKSKEAPYVCEAKGDLTISGVTNNVTMVVNILPLVYTNATTGATEKRLQIKGSIPVKMSDFKVPIVDISLGIGHIKTGDEVKLVFTWILGQRKTTAP
jgi:polyisoprenoid-binding protein YceI